MYESFYNLSGLPFQLSPDPRFYFDSKNHSRVMSYLMYGLNQSEGFVVITGDIGTGKTTLVGRLIANLDRNKYVAGRLVTTQLGPTDTLRMVATAFGVGEDNDDKATLLRKVEGFLIATRHSGKRPVLVIDEVQNMPMASLEELRMISNFHDNYEMLLQTVLLGQPQFKATLSKPELEQLRQRVIASCHLGPLSEAETRAYVEHRLRLVDWRDDPRISSGAFRAIFSYTEGVPRRINTLCTRILLYGFLEGLHSIDEGVVGTITEELRKELVEATTRPADAMDGGKGVTGSASAAGTEPESVLARIVTLERYVSAQGRTIERVFSLLTKHFSTPGPETARPVEQVGRVTEGGKDEAQPSKIPGSDRQC